MSDVIRRIPATPIRITTSHMQPTRVEGTETNLDRIVTNLLANAVGYARTTVDIAVERQDGHAILTIDDDGPGIPPEQRDQIWERFARVDHHRARTGGGSGLGLALVRELTAAHHGTVAVTQPPRLGGARFQVNLPISAEHARPSDSL